MTADIELPAVAPVMVLPNATLFPHSMVPLYIFEQRYRKMLAWALERDRMFCVALMKPGVTEAADVDDFHHIGGVGLIRASVANADGTSNLLLQGISRVRFTGFDQLSPFRIARIEPVETIPANDAAPLAEEVRQLCARFRQTGFQFPEKLDEYLERISDADHLADTVAHAFVSDAQIRQGLLEHLDTTARLRALADALREQLAG